MIIYGVRKGRNEKYPLFRGGIRITSIDEIRTVRSRFQRHRRRPLTGSLGKRQTSVIDAAH